MNKSKKIQFGCGVNYRTNEATLCSREWFEKQIDDSAVESRCVMAEMGQPEQKGYLPVIYAHASFGGSSRCNQNAVPSGLVMLDIDDKGGRLGLDAQQEAEAAKERLADFPEVLAIHVSASKHGIHVISKRVGMESILAEQDRLMKGLFPTVHPDCFDRSTTDLARAACLVPRSYFTYLNLDELFGGDWDERYVKLLEEQAVSVSESEDCEKTASMNESREQASASVSATRVQTSSSVSENREQAEVKSRISADGLMLGDLPYSDIVEALNEELGNIGNKGMRHAAVLELCRHLAFICKDAEHMERVLPEWALDHREHKSCIQSALTYVKGKKMPAALTRVLSRLEGGLTEAEPIEDAPTLPKNVHPAIAAIVAPYADGAREVFALASLPYLGTLGGLATFRYRSQEEHHLAFNTCIVAAQTVGKGALGRLQKVLLKPLMDADQETRQKMDDYKDSVNAAAGDQEKPRDPHYGLRVLNPKITLPALIENIKNNHGKFCVITAPEIDQLGAPGNWCRDGGAMERLMFDTDLGGQDTKSTNATSAYVPITLNMVTSGTPSRVLKHYTNTEDGMMTRVGFCSFPSWYDGEQEEKARTEANLKKIAEIQQTLMAEKAPEEPYQVKALLKQQLDWCAMMKTKSEMQGNSAIEVLRKRAAVWGFRAGCLLWLIDGKRVTKKALEFARWVSEYVLFYQLKFFGRSLDETIETNREIMSSRAVSLKTNETVFYLLPHTFTYAQVLEAFQAKGHKGSGYRTVVGRWVKNHWAKELSTGVFEKTDLGHHVIRLLTA